MFKKGLVTLVCLTVMSALWSWAATTYSISTKINSLGTKAVTVNGVVSYVPVIGGTIKVRDNAAQNLGIKYTNFTTSAAVSVVVTPELGYKLSALTKNGQTVAVPTNQTAAFPVSFVKPAPIATQTLVATFAVAGNTDVVAKTWQLQLSNQNRGGSIAAVRGADTTNVTLVGKAYVKNYIDTTPVTVTVTADAGYRIDYLIVDGIKTAYTSASQVVAINPAAGSRVKTVMAAYKKLAIPVTTNATPLVANGISPVNPVADVYGNVRLVVAPTGSNNIIQSLSVTKDLDGSAVAYTVTDRFGDAQTLPFRGSIKVTITGVTSAITVTPVYKKDNTLEMQNCTNTCHLNASAATQAVVAKWDASAHKANAVDCVTCHQTMPGPNYNTVALREVLCASCHIAGPNPNTLHTAAQNVCATCHTFGDAHNPAKANVAGSLAAKHTGAGTVADGAAGNAQYLSKNGLCVDCHASANTAILTEWAESAHGQAIPAAGLAENAWNAGEGSNASCARCHTTSGFISNPTNSGTTIALLGTDKQEVLGCKGCHTNVTNGDLRVASAAYNLPYQIQGTDSAIDTIPALGASSTCIPCHAGRASGAAITTNTFSSRFPSSHYLVAGGTMFNTIGYHFAGQTYNTSGVHKTIGGNGPCVTCHMNSATAGKGHSFEAVTKVDGVITAINTAAACASCHAVMTPAKLNADKATFAAALETLRVALQTKEGAFYNPAAGKFYTDATFTTEKKPYSSAAALGAAYNYYVLEHAEPAAYVHNRGYAFKLIADSVDFLNDGIINGDSGIVLTHSGPTLPGTVTAANLAEVKIAVNACETCHAVATSAISADWAAGAHGTASGHTTGTCQRCHATEGAIAAANVGWTGGYTDVVGNAAVIAAIWTPNAPASSNNGVSCAACHSQENFLRSINTYVNGAVVAWDPNANGTTDQYDVCTSCHSLTNNAGALVGNYHDGGSINVTRTISDSHYDNPATAAAGGVSAVVEGYVLRTNSANPCADCHNLHTADLTVQEAWATSAHAGKIATKKEAALCDASLAAWNTANPTNTATACTEIKASGRTIVENYGRTAAGITTARAAGALDDLDGNAWTHYNWDQTSSRGACQRCHTATGAANFLSNPATYDATGNGNNFSHLSGWTTTAGSPQNELLYCWGCHSNSQNGTLRNPGALTEVYAAATAGAPAATVVYPDLGNSNVCMACHVGREIGQNVANDTDADGVRGFINSHYLAAGATIFNESGYEYAGQSYDNLGYHKNVGMNDAYNTGTAGPCVTCHMTSAEGHSFEVSAASTTCVNCHAGLTAAALEASEHEFHLALEELNVALKAKGIEFKPAHPYFYQINTTTAFTDWAGVYGLDKWKDVMGAAFNYNLLEHDPGAYAHNRQYALKLIKDSIDFLADGVVDGNGVSAAFTAAAANKEFAELTSHPAAIVASGATAVESCATCHQTAPHVSSNTATEAQYAAQQISCTDCHAAGDTTANAAILVQYAESGHGDVKGAAWVSSEMFNNTCARCHSTSAFITGAAPATAFTTLAAGGTQQVLACNGCHTSVETGEVRAKGAITATFKSRTFDAASSTWNAAALATFPDTGEGNNLCISCHSGRESGESILALTDASMSNTGFKNPHYLGAAGMMYAKLAFIDFTDRDTVVGTTTYGKSLTSNEDGGGLTSTHRKLGTPAMATDSHVGGQVLISGGPCVTCHMATTKNHTWEIGAEAFTGVCVKCHDEEAGTPLTTANFKELFIEEQAVPFNDAVAVANKTLLTKFNIEYTDSYPYFFDNSLATPAAVKDWTRGGTLSAADAKKLHGACLNIKLMKADPAAYAHARSYVRRVLYDTIDWLDDQTINMSTGNTALAAFPAKYVKDATAAGTTTESFKFLAGYNRTSLIWNASERP